MGCVCFTVVIILTVALALAAVTFFVLVSFAKRVLQKKRALQKSEDDRLVVGLFHPYCNAGGGGERVLWCAVRSLQKKYPDARLVIYTGDVHVSPEEIKDKAEKTFKISLSSPVDLVYLHKRKWVEAAKYPRLTLLGQSIGSMYLGIEALFEVVPDIYIDTMGYAFTLPLFKYLGECKVGCYVHYPTISTDMLSRVMLRTSTHNNNASIARSRLLTRVKLYYYRLFAKLYGAVGRNADIVMVNSSWTEEHINNLWNIPDKTQKVYPPCNVDEFKKIPLSDDSEKTTMKIISVAQFRPEKDHPLQIRTMYQLREIVSEETWKKIKLILIGSCRNEEDEVRLQDLKDLAKHFSVEDNVEFKENISFEELKEELQSGIIGLHTMWNEHFGIGVVECMAAGLVMVAHCSGGPQMDIVIEYDGSRNGFLATDEFNYSRLIDDILHFTPEARLSLKEKARASVDRFSDQEFEIGFLRAVEPLFREFS